jgi:endonuclease/exonuclease/phosphatase family metal-dependent hydrolase
MLKRKTNHKHRHSRRKKIRTQHRMKTVSRRVKMLLHGGTSPEMLKKKFISLVEHGKPKQKPTKQISKPPIPAKASGAVLRLATFNVHYFTDVYENKNTYREVLDVIMSINADVIILQEILVGGSHVVINPDITLDISTMFERFEAMGYKKVINCTTVPSWFNSSYGNIMLVKDAICPMTETDRVCESIDETTYTFTKSLSATTVSGLHQGVKETRCFIYVKVKINNVTYHIIGTHLDVSSETTRLNQIQHIVETYEPVRGKGQNDVIIIMGDFNTFDPNQYKDLGGEYAYLQRNNFTKDNGLVYQYLIDNGYNDITSSPPQLFTTWNLTRVDFIFSSRPIRTACYTMYTTASDHLPVVADIFESTVD